MGQSTGIKVSEDTKEKIRLTAALLDLQQGQLVERAIDEFVERRETELRADFQRAQAALLGGRTTTIAFLLGEDADDVAAVSGPASKQP